MRLIVSYTSDNGIDSWDHVLPVVADSKDAFLMDLELAAVEARKEYKSEVIVCGQEFNVCSLTDFEQKEGRKSHRVTFGKVKFYPPQVQTVDEWFSEVEKTK